MASQLGPDVEVGDFMDIGNPVATVIETDPVSPTTLGHWHRFSVHFGYETDRPMRVHGKAYRQAREVTSITGGSPYGASHLASPWNTAVSADEAAVAKALGARVARLAQALAAAR